MNPAIRAARGGLGGRRLQAVIIGLVVLVSTAASVLSLGMLADAHTPFDHAFAAQHGAHVTAEVDGSVASAPAVAATKRLPGVTAAAGPFPEAQVSASVTVPGVTGSMPDQLTIAGRSSAGGPVDDLTLTLGHWARSNGQAVIGQDSPGGVGSTITVGSVKLTVVGVATSVTGTAQAWVLPSQIPALRGYGPGGPAEQLLYRFASAGSAAAVSADVASLRRALPAGALLSTQSYLTVRQAEESNIAPWVPFIIAFGVLALAISVLIVVNVVSGAVLAGTTRIGIMKSLGFTPLQVVFSYVLLVAVPSLIAVVAGAVCGNLLAVPLLARNAQVYQVGRLGVPAWVDVAVPLAVLALTVAAAVPPSWRAGRMSAVAAIATGRAPRPARGYLAHRVLARLRALPRPVTLGLALPFARPARTLITLLAIVAGAAAVTFGTGLATSLNRVNNDLRLPAAPVHVYALPAIAAGRGSAGGPGGGSGASGKPAGKAGVPGKIFIGPQSAVMSGAQQHAILTALRAVPGTARYIAEAHDQLSLPGVARPAQVTGFGSDSNWMGYAMISGHWLSGPDQAVVNTEFLTDTGTTVGSRYTFTSGGHRVTVRITGEVLGPGDDVEIFLNMTTLRALEPGDGLEEYAVGLSPGTNPQAYANALSAALGGFRDGYGVENRGGSDGQFLAVIALISMLTILIVVVAGLGVLNTVALQIRERAHDLAVFKAVGMTPRQILAVVVISVAVIGVAGGVIAVPAGVYLHHGVLPVMAHAANSNLPQSVLTVFGAGELVLLGLAGLVIAVLGALGPAGWTARSRTAAALRAE